MLSRLIVSIAYFLKTSRHYHDAKSFFYNLLENPDSRLKSNFDMFMICLVMFSVFLLIYSVDNQPADIDALFEGAVLATFAIEYLLRVWLYNDSHKIVLEHYEKAQYLNIPFSSGHIAKTIAAQKIEFMLTPLALIDLLAILPSYKPLQILEFFLVFRLFKLFRYFSSLRLFTEVLASKRFELLTLAIFLGFVIFIGGTAIYLFEKPTNSKEVSHLFDAIYFTIVTVATVGYGDITPHTTGGRLVAIALILSGLGVLSFLTSILVSAFSDKMDDMRENQTYNELKRYESFVIICGFGRVGEHIAFRLAKDKQQFVVIDINENNILKAKRLGYLVIHADASKNDVLKHAGINNRGIQAVLCTTGNDVVNVYITLTSRHLNPTVRIISRANKPGNVKKLYQAGANDVIQPFEIAGMVAAEYIGQPVAFEAIFGILRQEKQFIMEAVEVVAGSVIDNQSIAELNFTQRKLVLIGVISANPMHIKHRNRYQISHQHFYFNPAQHFVLQASDLLVLLGRDISISYFRELIGQSRGHKP